jgi:hypothetical protein
MAGKIAVGSHDCETTVRKISNVCVSGEACLYPRFSGAWGPIASLGTIRLAGGRFIGPDRLLTGLHGPCHSPSPKMPLAGRRALSIRLKAFRQPRRRLRWTDCTSGTASRRHRIGKRAALPMAGQDGSRRPSRCRRSKGISYAQHGECGTSCETIGHPDGLCLACCNPVA